MTETSQKAGDRKRPLSPVLTGLPNMLTYARIVAVPVVVGCLLVGGDTARW